MDENAHKHTPKVNWPALGIIATFATIIVGPLLTFLLASPAPFLLKAGVIIFIILWLVIILILINPLPSANAQTIINWLSDEPFNQAYRTLTSPILDWFGARLEFVEPQGDGKRATLWATLTAQLYDRALLIAFAYPLVLIVVLWAVTGQAGVLGGVTLLKGSAPWDLWPERALVLCLIAYGFAGIVMRLWSKKKRLHLRFVLILRVYVAAFIIYEVILFLGDVTGSALLVLMLAFMLAFIDAGVGAVVRAFAFAFMSLRDQGKLTLALVVLTLGFMALWVFTAFFVDVEGLAVREPKEYELILSVFIFLWVLPLINAWFDTLSYAVTLTTARLGLRRYNPFLMGLLDAVAALALFLGLGITLIFVLRVLNILAQSSWGYGAPIINLGALVDDIWADPTAHLWVFLMLFSTAAPTVFHLVLALLGAQAFVPRRARQGALRSIDKMQRGDTVAAFVAPLLVAMIAMLPVAVALLVLHVTWYFSHAGIIWLLNGYGDVLRAVAGTAGV